MRFCDSVNSRRMKIFFILRIFVFSVFSFLVLTALVGCRTTRSSTESLRKEISGIIENKEAIVGIAIVGDDGRDTLSWNGHRHCPLQSVFKYHIALTVLSEIDKGRLTLDEVVEVKKGDLLPEEFWSPLRDENPEGGNFTIRKLIQYSVCQSDNVACDVLIRLVGTPKTIEEFFKSNGIQDIAINVNEKDMQAEWDNMFTNWTTPMASTETLRMFYLNQGHILSQASHEFFWQTMKETTTGKGRLRGLLPQETIVAHKTGSSGTSDDGLTPATNDVGIVFLPGGDYFIISVFVTDSKEDDETNEEIIARIARAAYDYFSGNKFAGR